MPIEDSSMIRLLTIIHHQLVIALLKTFILRHALSFSLVAPDSIHQHVKTCQENIKNMHFVAPEYGGSKYLRNMSFLIRVDLKHNIRKLSLVQIY